ncbi:MAG: hypothetical protein MUO58_17680, partial [Anaerolineales bacterium]|nr:hypothetical protein [Anaerolineales bacterium]
MDRRSSLFSKSSNQSWNFHGLNARAITVLFAKCLLLSFLIAGLAACQSSESPTASSPDAQATQSSGGGETTGEDPVDEQETPSAG